MVRQSELEYAVLRGCGDKVALKHGETLVLSECSVEL